MEPVRTLGAFLDKLAGSGTVAGALGSIPGEQAAASDSLVELVDTAAAWAGPVVHIRTAAPVEDNTLHWAADSDNIGVRRQNPWDSCSVRAA